MLPANSCSTAVTIWALNCLNNTRIMRLLFRPSSPTSLQPFRPHFWHPTYKLCKMPLRAILHRHPLGCLILLFLGSWPLPKRDQTPCPRGVAPYGVQIVVAVAHQFTRLSLLLHSLIRGVTGVAPQSNQMNHSTLVASMVHLVLPRLCVALLVFVGTSRWHLRYRSFFLLFRTISVFI